jgi:hypothetical protein
MGSVVLVFRSNDLLYTRKGRKLAILRASVKERGFSIGQG